MKLLKFSNYEEYIQNQRWSDRMKSSRSAARPEEISMIAKWAKEQKIEIRSAMCHGARRGQEIDWFGSEFPGADVIGTDLFPKGHPKVIEWDFHKSRADWEGKFDLIYSNSLDHSHSPKEMLGLWSRQLRPGGGMFIQWTTWHTRASRGDCFGADLIEYVWIVNRVVKVDCVLCLTPKYYVIAGKKGF